MPRLTPRQDLEIRRQAEMWAARLVRDHGCGAEAVMLTILRRPDLGEASRYAGFHTLLAVQAILRGRGHQKARNHARAMAVRRPQTAGILGTILHLLSLGHYRPRHDGSTR